MTVSGPGGFAADISGRIEPVGNRSWLGSDVYTGTTDLISGGEDGDEYECNMTSSRSGTGSVSVTVAAPNISSLQQTAPTAATVVWTAQQLSVTGYRVHYHLSSGVGTTQTIDVDDADTTTIVIPGLTNGQSYTVSVEVTLNSTTVVPGVSGERTVRLAPTEPPGDVVCSVPIVVGVVVGVAVGVSGLIGGAFIAKCRPGLKRRKISTEDNLAYGMNIPQRKAVESKGDYEVPQYIEPAPLQAPAATEEGVYEGLY